MINNIFFLKFKFFLLNLYDFCCSEIKLKFLHKCQSNFFIKLLLVFIIIICTSTFIFYYNIFYFRDSYNRTLLSPILNNVFKDNTLIFDSSGTIISEVYDKYSIYVPFESIPSHMLNAIISIEDKNFWKHKGYDLKAILRSIIKNFKSFKFNQGASTITQQIIKNFILDNKRSINRKINEISLAVSLERLLSKKKIFEIYVNTMFLGNGAYGIGAAAKKYFNKSLDELKLHEIALIAGLFQSPSKTNPFTNPHAAKLRQQQVLKAMYLQKFISKSEYLQAINAPLNYQKHVNPHSQYAPYFVDYVISQTQKILSLNNIANLGLRIYTTLNPNIQKIINNCVKNYYYKHINNIQSKISFNTNKHLPNTKLSDLLELAILVINPKNGEILGMRGGKDYNTSKFNRVTQSRRAIGSLFKPVIYSLALENKFSWYDTILVSPISIDGYKPKDVQNHYLESSTLLKAFYDSYNSAAIEIGTKLGLEAVINHAYKLGIKSKLKLEHSTLLGSANLSMFEIANLYGVFANSGNLVDLIAIHKIKDYKGNVLWESPTLQSRTHQVLDLKTAALMHTGLTSVIKYGTAKRVSYLSEHIAGKTGTSNYSRDNWFCGYSSDTLALIWVGTDDNTELYGKAYGSTLALPIWEYLMFNIAQIRPFKEYNFDDILSSAYIHPIYGYLFPQGIKIYFDNDKYPTQMHSSYEKIKKNKVFRKIF